MVAEFSYKALESERRLMRSLTPGSRPYRMRQGRTSKPETSTGHHQLFQLAPKAVVDRSSRPASERSGPAFRVLPSHFNQLQCRGAESVIG